MISTSFTSPLVEINPTKENHLSGVGGRHLATCAAGLTALMSGGVLARGPACLGAAISPTRGRLEWRSLSSAPFNMGSHLKPSEELLLHRPSASTLVSFHLNDLSCFSSSAIHGASLHSVVSELRAGWDLFPKVQQVVNSAARIK
ncbi:unnamed protein product [Pleuronectes platessa]|uniref:Uncharacterized protein n=1 Tax=Pleuronectes platessa TaxID=8262 RepID=A0A9N7UWT7_PLEPL|nr:unnamed protein product [Pleuronectes platessa]